MQSVHNHLKMFIMETIKNFFDKYSILAHGQDLKALADCYADHFIAAGPKGIMAFSNNEKFIEWLESIQSFNKKSGLQEMTPVKVISSAIGKAYRFATVTWSVVFAGKKDQPIEFDISYILFHYGGNYKIVQFVSHEDQEEVMKEKGLL